MMTDDEAERIARAVVAGAELPPEQFAKLKRGRHGERLRLRHGMLAAYQAGLAGEDRPEPLRKANRLAKAAYNLGLGERMRRLVEQRGRL